MDKDDTLSEKIRLLFVRYEHFVRTLPANHSLRSSFYTGKASLSDRNEHDVKVPYDPAAFLNDFLRQFHGLRQIFDQMGQPEEFRKRFDSLEQIITELSWKTDSISKITPSESCEIPDLKRKSRPESVANIKKSSKLVYPEDDSDSDKAENAHDHKDSRQSMRQSDDKARLSGCDFVDLTTEDPILRSERDVISIPDSSEGDDRACVDNPEKKQKGNHCQDSQAISPSNNNVLNVVQAISESVDLLYDRCRKFSGSLPAGHSFRTSYFANEERLPDLDCEHFEVRVPSDPKDFMNDISSRFDEVYRLYDRLGRPYVLSERLNSLRSLISELSETPDLLWNVASNQNSAPPRSKDRKPRRAARLKNDAKFKDQEIAKCGESCDFAQPSTEGNRASKDKGCDPIKTKPVSERKRKTYRALKDKRCDLKAKSPGRETQRGTNRALKDKRCDLTANQPEREIQRESTRHLGASEDESLLDFSTETEAGERAYRVHDSNIAPVLQILGDGVSLIKTTPKENEILENSSVSLPEVDYEGNPVTESDVPAVLQNLSPFLPRDLPRLSIRASGNAQESHNKPIYCVSWSKDLSRSNKEAKDQCVSRYLATCGSKFATVYRVGFDSSSRPRRGKSKHFIMTQSHISDDEEESFYACAFAGRSGGYEPNQSGSSSESMPELLCVGGARRVINVIDLAAKKTIMTLHGHGESVLNLKPCPTDEWILLSTSEDESIRLWNLRSGAPVAVLKGREGHFDSVVCAAWNLDASLIISGGMDTLVKIWDTREGSQLNEAIAKSHETVDLFRLEGAIIHEKPLLVTSPIFSTQRTHINCVDCVQFIQNGLVLSKSVDSRIELWEPILDGPESVCLRMRNQSKVQHLYTFVYEKGEVWYMNFATDPLFKRLAVGDCAGYVHVWNIGQKSSSPAHVLSTHGRIHVPVRGVLFSPCGNTLLAYRDDGSLIKWDL